MSVKPVAWTPGPWQARAGYGHWNVTTVAGPRTFNICRVDNNRVEQEGNAALICAAPELAEALQNLVRAYEAVVRGEVGNVGEKANPEFYAAISLLARITPK